VACGGTVQSGGACTATAATSQAYAGLSEHDVDHRSDDEGKLEVGSGPTGTPSTAVGALVGWSGAAEGTRRFPRGSGVAQGARHSGTGGWPSANQTFGKDWLLEFHRGGDESTAGLVRHPFTRGPGTPRTTSRQGDATKARTCTWVEMNEGDYSGDDSDEENDLDMGDINPDSVQWRFRNETWTHAHFTYDPPRRPFRGQRGPVKH
jgi:hypothetical protein